MMDIANDLHGDQSLGCKKDAVGDERTGVEKTLIARTASSEKNEHECQDFSGLIEQTEAAIRNKLSTLTMPDPSLSPEPDKGISATVSGPDTEDNRSEGEEKQEPVTSDCAPVQKSVPQTMCEGSGDEEPSCLTGTMSGDVMGDVGSMGDKKAGQQVAKETEHVAVMDNSTLEQKTESKPKDDETVTITQQSTTSVANPDVTKATTDPCATTDGTAKDLSLSGTETSSDITVTLASSSASSTNETTNKYASAVKRVVHDGSILPADVTAAISSLKEHENTCNKLTKDTLYETSGKISRDTDQGVSSKGTDQANSDSGICLVTAVPETASASAEGFEQEPLEVADEGNMLDEQNDDESKYLASNGIGSEAENMLNGSLMITDVWSLSSDDKDLLEQGDDRNRLNDKEGGDVIKQDKIEEVKDNNVEVLSSSTSDQGSKPPSVSETSSTDVATPSALYRNMHTNGTSGSETTDPADTVANSLNNPLVHPTLPVRPVIKSEPVDNDITLTKQNDPNLSHLQKQNASMVKLLNGKKVSPVAGAENQKKLIMTKVGTVSSVANQPGGLKKSLFTTGRPRKHTTSLLSPYFYSSPSLTSAANVLVAKPTSSMPTSIPKVQVSNLTAPALIATTKVLVSKTSSSALSSTTKVLVSKPNSSKPFVVQVSPILPKQTPIKPKKINSEYINIQTVGVPKITELIARKNPLPVYKPLSIIDLVNNEPTMLHTCFECGDAFNHEKSLSIHTNRCSMKITYTCDVCTKVLNFTNKCQLLGHLRSHMNIEKTKAVPIHIKSDSIEIRSNYHDIVNQQNFEWYKPAQVSPESSQEKFQVVSSVKPVSVNECPICRQVFADVKDRKNHFAAFNSDRTYQCDECPLILPNSCALEAHKRVHTFLKNGGEMDNATCPECGQMFQQQSHFMNHLLLICFHMSRLMTFRCTKCLSQSRTLGGLRKHLLITLDQYYKCQLCPLALKSFKGFKDHYESKHQKFGRPKAKIIYRCHVCDTLVDDRSFLESHLDKHVEEIKKYLMYRFQCLKCGQMFLDKNELMKHPHRLTNNTKSAWTCGFCTKTVFNQMTFMNHVMLEHKFTENNGCKVIFCDDCGMLCFGNNNLKSHTCFSANSSDFDVADSTKIQKRQKLTRKPDELDCSLKQLELSDKLKSCKKCSVAFKTVLARSLHMKEHLPFQIYICTFCDRSNFSSFHDLKSHEILCSAMLKQKMSELKSAKEAWDVFLAIPSEKKVNGDSGKKPSKSTPKKDSLKEKKSKNFEGVTLTPETVPKGKKQEVPVYFACGECTQVFSRKSKRDDHVKAEHGYHLCHLCGLIYESQSDLKRHLKIEHEGRKLVYYCWMCRARKVSKWFSEIPFLEKHLEKKHRLKSWDRSKLVPEVPGLDEEPGCSSQAMKHKLTSEEPSVQPVKKLRVDGETSFKCAKCLFNCEVKVDFLKHIVEHKTPSTVQCYECGLCFTVFSSLQKHLFCVHKIRDFQGYIMENNIDVTVEEMESEDEIEREPVKEEVEEESSEEEGGNPLECKVCYKGFDTENALNGHMRIHGMAFIRKSRRRSLPKSVPCKVEDVKVEAKTKDDTDKKTDSVNDSEGMIKVKMETEIDVDGVPEKDMDFGNQVGDSSGIKGKKEASTKTSSCETTVTELVVSQGEGN